MMEILKAEFLAHTFLLCISDLPVLISALQINIISLPVIMNRKIKRPLFKINFRSSQENNE